jgi:hypothetical protein
LFWQTESVIEVGVEALEASALNRRTKQSPSCTMPLESGVTPIVPGGDIRHADRPSRIFAK